MDGRDAAPRGSRRADRSPASDLADWVRPRARLVGSALAVGIVAGACSLAALTWWTGGARGSEATAFALGALGFGFGVLGWSGSVAAGRSVEAMQRHVETATDWTEQDSRRAMARVTGFGAGIMVGTSLLAALL